MISRRHFLAVPMLPAAGALAPGRRQPTPEAPPADPVADAGLVDDRGWIVTSDDRAAIAAVRQQRLAREAAATIVQPTAPKPGTGRRGRGKPKRRSRRGLPDGQ